MQDHLMQFETNLIHELAMALRTHSLIATEKRLDSYGNINPLRPLLGTATTKKTRLESESEFQLEYRRRDVIDLPLRSSLRAGSDDRRSLVGRGIII